MCEARAPNDGGKLSDIMISCASTCNPQTQKDKFNDVCFLERINITLFTPGL